MIDAVREATLRKLVNTRLAQPPRTQPPTRQRSRCPRAGLVTPALYVGGAEQWMHQLVESTRPAVEWVGLVCVDEAAIAADVARRFDALLPVFGPGSDAVRNLYDADVLVTWGPTGLGPTIREFAGSVVSVSHGGDEPWNRPGIPEETRATLRQPVRWVAVSEAAKQAFAALPDAQSVVVLPNGIDTRRLSSSVTRAEARTQLGYADGDFVVGTIGRLGEEKRLDLVAAAIRNLPPRYKFLSVGSGPVLERLRDWCRPIQERTQLVPATFEIAQYLAAMDAFVMASAAEGFCLAALEALYAGVPLIATPVGILPAFQDCYTQLPVDASIEGIQEAVAAVAAAESSHLASRSQIARAIVEEQYTLKQFGARWAGYLASVSGHPHPSSSESRQLARTASPAASPPGSRLSAPPPPVRGAFPSAGRMAWNLAKALSEFAADVAANGLRDAIVDQSEYERRLAICDACALRSGGRCLHCGCFLAVKAKGRAWKCPKNKWKKND